MFDSATHALQYARLPCPSLSPGVCSNSCLLRWWGHPTISSSITPFSSCSQSFPASGSFPMSRLFASGGLMLQSIGASASALALLMNIQGWFSLGLTIWSPCHPKDSQEFSPASTVRKHKFFSAQSFLWSNSHICT